MPACEWYSAINTVFTASKAQFQVLNYLMTRCVRDKSTMLQLPLNVIICWLPELLVLRFKSSSKYSVKWRLLKWLLSRLRLKSDLYEGRQNRQQKVSLQDPRARSKGLTMTRAFDQWLTANLSNMNLIVHSLERVLVTLCLQAAAAAALRGAGSLHPHC